MSTFYVDSASIENLYVTDLTAVTSSIQYITSSQLNIGTNIITVNTNTTPLRFGGLAVADSGSSPIVSGSLLFDSINDQWIFIHQQNVGSPVTSSVLIMGPQTFNDVGNEITITPNRLTKGQAGDLGEHITSSNISDDGTTVSINSNSEITGSLHHLGTFYPNQIDWFSSSIGYDTGSYILTTTANGLTTYANYQDVATVINNGLLTTSSFNAYTGSSTSQFAGTASYTMQSLSASYALTASYIENAQTSSFITSSNVYGPYGSNSVVSASFAVSASWAPGGAGVTINNNTDNYLVTATGTPATLNGEANLTFNGSTLAVTGNVTANSFTGSLQGTATTASYVENAQTASYVQNAVSSSFATTASFANNSPVQSSTSGVGSSPTATQTDTINHGLGRTPVKIRIYGMGGFTSNASATPTPFSIGTWTSSGNRCIYQPIGATITTAATPVSSTTFAIRIDTAAGANIQGIIQNVNDTSFQISWTETGAVAARVYLWEVE